MAVAAFAFSGLAAATFAATARLLLPHPVLLFHLLLLLDWLLLLQAWLRILSL